ncbi:hypothetical protein Cgig2_033231 [Carnegiea gigantea]|uniref:Uncharacterized protein n=1 Tax=Carnegiea gigantea TaxID=171969 RepID=A0A9Q1QAZ8_9CARY|nr:hypothetical protein Cgig2_033231 [Carnegiea gigantea]
MSVKSVLHVHHGGGFQKIPHVVHGLEEMKKVECDTDYVSVDNIKGIAIELGMEKERLRKYTTGSQILVSIESDEEVRELILLSKSFEYVSLYVEYNDEPQSVVSANNGNESNNGDSDSMADDKYEEYGSKVEDGEVSWIRGEKKKMHDEMVADLDELRAKNRENWGERNDFDDIYSYYQESDDADSPASSESDDDDDDGDKGRKSANSRPSIQTEKKGNYKFKRRPEEEERRPKSQHGVVSCSGGTAKYSLLKNTDPSTCAQLASARPETASAAVTEVGAIPGHTVSIVSSSYGSEVE